MRRRIDLLDNHREARQDRLRCGPPRAEVGCPGEGEVGHTATRPLMPPSGESMFVTPRQGDASMRDFHPVLEQPMPVTAITSLQVRRARLHNQLLPGQPARAPGAVAAWLGAMQSQDHASGMWSLGARCPGLDAGAIQAAFERAEVLRTWPMRGTIHTIESPDARWLLALTGVRALDASRGRREQLNLDLTTAERAADLLVAALAERPHLTRRQALAVLEDARISTAGQRGYYLLWFSAQTGRTCLGPNVEGEQTFVDLGRWAPHQRHFERADAVTELVHRYFRSHGPATEADAAGWSGLPLRDIRAGLAANSGRLERMASGDRVYWMSGETAQRLAEGAFQRKEGVVVLPGFDEFILGFKDREPQLAPERFARIVPGGNGVFRATVLVDGEVVASWTRTMRSRRVEVDVELFGPASPADQRGMASAFSAYADFLGLGLSLTVHHGA